MAGEYPVFFIYNCYMSSKIKEIYRLLDEVTTCVNKQDKLYDVSPSLTNEIIQHFTRITNFINEYGSKKFAKEHKVFWFKFNEVYDKWIKKINDIQESRIFKFANKSAKNIKTKKPIQKLTSCEMYIYEMLTFERFVLDKKPDHKHYHYYYTENKDGIGRWRKYEDIINYITLTIYKMIVERPRTSPFDSKNCKKRPILIKYPKSVKEEFLKYAENANLMLGDVTYRIAMDAIKEKVKDLLGEWKKIA